MTAATMTLTASTARGPMTSNPISIDAHATLKDAAAFLTKRSISAAPVINDAGKPVGVLSRTDIVRFSSGDLEAPQMLGDFINEAKAQHDSTRPNSVTVDQVMTPFVVSVSLDASLAEACEKMVERKVRRLFVIDHDGVVVGVISALDVLHCLGRKPLTVSKTKGSGHAPLGQRTRSKA